MNKLLFTIIMALAMSASAWGQTGTVVEMTSTAQTVSLTLDWEGSGTITANGTPIEKNARKINIPVLDSSIELVATEDVILTSLNCVANELTSLDVSKCTELTSLSCYNNPDVVSLDVTMLTKLTTLNCSGKFTHLDVSKNTELTNFSCHSQLTTLDVSMLTKLTYLACGNQLTSLDVTKLTKLESLSCSNNQLTSLDLSNCTELSWLYCSGNHLTDLDVTMLPKLRGMDANNQTITLPEALTAGISLTIENPITYNGSKVANIAGATYNNGNISWSGLTAANGDAAFTFTTTLPNGIQDGGHNSPFSGTVKQPWVNNGQVITGTTIATMETRKTSANITVEWEGDGTVTANGMMITNSKTDVISVPVVNGKVDLVTTGNITLTYLDCRENSLTSLDVSKCTGLIYLRCNDNLLTNLDASKCTQLEQLFCYKNTLSGLNVSTMPKLRMLSCDRNSLTSLDISKCTLLELASCYDNLLTSLDVSKCPQMEIVNCANNLLTSLNVSMLSKLTNLRCDRNSLTTLDVSKCTKLTILQANNQNITLQQATTSNTDLTIANPVSYNGSKVTTVTGATAAGNNIIWTGLSEASGNATFTFTTNLPNGISLGYNLSAPFSGTVTQPWVKGNSTPTGTIATMTSTAATINITLQWDGSGTVEANGTPIKNGSPTANIPVVNGKVDLIATGNVTVTSLICNINSLTSLDVSKLKELKSLTCLDNSLTSLDLSKCTELTQLNCNSNKLTSLDVSMLTELTELSCGLNSLKSLDVSKCIALITLNCHYNSLTNLDVSKCTQLTYLSCQDNSLNNLDVSNLTKLTHLGCANSKLTILDVSMLTELTTLSCYLNPLTSLDVSMLTKLTNLTCSNNSLTSLDVSMLAELTYLDCRYNSLLSLDVSKCTKLTTLRANHQNVTLQQVVKGSNSLIIENPVTFNGSKINKVTGATTEGGNIVWTGLSGASGNATFTFEATLPSGMGQTSTPFSGTVTQPWVYDATSITISVNANNASFGTVSGGGAYSPGSSVTIKATANEGYCFTNWTEGGKEVSTNINYTFVADKNRAFTANFTVCSVNAEEPEPIKDDGNGSIDFWLNIPAGASITGTFEIKLPEGYSLNPIATQLISSLAENYELTFRNKGNNVWQITISEVSTYSLSLRSSTTLTKIMNIAYTVDPTVPNGIYQIEILNVDMVLDNGTKITEDKITIPTTVSRNVTGLPSIESCLMSAYSRNGNLVVRSCPSETITVYTITGIQVRHLTSQSNETVIASLRTGIYIVTVGTKSMKVFNR